MFEIKKYFMTLKKTILAAFIFLTNLVLAQESIVNPLNNTVIEFKTSYLDSMKAKFKKDKMAIRVDSLWLKDITNLDLYNNLSADIININIDEKVDFELPTALLKSRLKEMDAKSPFNIEYNQGLENIIKSFLKNRKRSFERLMAISEYYFPLFEEALARQNVPLEIKYLAVVESALNPKAVSKMGATGLWQFMYQTGKQYNLNIDSYVDERSDPLRASEAAALYMSKMYKIFGDWDLVLASYNSGPGNVTKAIRRSNGQQNFWNIRKHLPRETQGYVPAFLATMYIYEFHKEHGIKPERALVKHFATDTIMIKQQISFRQIADLLEMPVSQIQMLNPSYKMNVIPYYRNIPHFLRLPTDKIAVFTSNEDIIYDYVAHEADKREKTITEPVKAVASKDSMTEETSRIVYKTVSKTKIHKVKRGDNLGDISEKYGVSIAEIKKWNKLRNNNVALGRNLKIVVSEKEKTVVFEKQARKQLTPKDTVSAKVVVIDAKKSKENTLAKQEIEKVTKTVDADLSTFYTVKKGDNLDYIAKKTGVSVADLKKWNKLSGNSVKANTKIKLEGDASELVANEPKVTTKKSDFYTVKKGDNLGNIAKKTGVTVADLKKWNKLSSSNVMANMKLNLTDSEAVVGINEEINHKAKNYYKVQKGDNIGSIAKKHGVSIEDIQKWNNLNSENIQADNILLIYNSETTEKIAKIKPKEQDKKETKNNLYLVKKGDSFFTIAQKYPGVTVDDIKKWNGISSNNLQPGMKLKING